LLIGVFYYCRIKQLVNIFRSPLRKIIIISFHYAYKIFSGTEIERWRFSSSRYFFHGFFNILFKTAARKTGACAQSFHKKTNFSSPACTISPEMAGSNGAGLKIAEVKFDKMLTKG